MAIAKIGDKEQVCFQTTDGKNGIWIPSFALVDREKWIITESQTELIKEKQKTLTTSVTKKIETENKQSKSVKEAETEENALVLGKKKAAEDLALMVTSFDSLLENFNQKVATDIESMNKIIDDAKILIEKTTNDIQKLGKNHLQIVNEYLNNVLSSINNLVNEILQTIQNTWHESLRESIALIMKNSKLYFDSAKRKIDYLKKTYPTESNHSLAQRLTNHLMFISLKSGIYGVKINSWETITSLSIKLDLIEITTLLTKLIYGISILHGFDEFQSNTEELISILALCLTFDTLKQLGLDSLIQSLKVLYPVAMTNTIVEPMVNISVNAVSNVALFQLIGHSSYLYYDIKANKSDNPIISGKAYQQFTTEIEGYLDGLLNEKDKLSEIVKDILQINKKVKALA